jgi:hypothetical protein
VIRPGRPVRILHVYAPCEQLGAESPLLSASGPRTATDGSHRAAIRASNARFIPESGVFAAPSKPARVENRVGRARRANLVREARTGASSGIAGFGQHAARGWTDRVGSTNLRPRPSAENRRRVSQLQVVITIRGISMRLRTAASPQGWAFESQPSQPSRSNSQRHSPSVR